MREALQQQRSNDDNNNNVVVIGHGNVALDCARILAKGAKGLLHTDLATRALNVLQETSIGTISIVGRRGHVQGSFTIKEVRELVKLKAQGHDTDCIVRQDELDMGSTTDASMQEVESSRPKRRIHDLLRQTAAAHTAAIGTLRHSFVVCSSVCCSLTYVRAYGALSAIPYYHRRRTTLPCCLPTIGTTLSLEPA